jgi:hypothetical protein
MKVAGGCNIRGKQIISSFAALFANDRFAILFPIVVACAIPPALLMSPIGTKRTNRVGRMMSVDRARPEVAGRRSKRRL